ncbi:hypothetical protein R3P38DRAFT_2815694 [Favolaschia claudopus]|uniref:Uncharacterized protein n=1 Tax=Favolaschia claudopus TaxID=2862362 RepID=A0AAV9Z0Q8_9AGAR
MFSADILFTPCGEETGINYQALYEDYVKRLREGLRLEDSWALELFRYWDSVLFPNADDSLGQSAAGDQAAAGRSRRRLQCLRASRSVGGEHPKKASSHHVGPGKLQPRLLRESGFFRPDFDDFLLQKVAF